MKTASRGFTLIELLVVIAIIGILSSVVLASLAITRSKSRDTRRIQDARQVITALELHLDRYGYYPGTPDSWYGSNTGDQWIPDLVDEFIPVLPQDPVNLNTYPDAPELVYYYATNGTEYCFQISQENDCSDSPYYDGVWGGTCKLSFETSPAYCDSL